MRFGVVCLLVLSLLFAPAMIGCGGGGAIPKAGEGKKPELPTGKIVVPSGMQPKAPSK